jgi:hypothetical protein
MNNYLHLPVAFTRGQPISSKGSHESNIETEKNLNIDPESAWNSGYLSMSHNSNYLRSRVCPPSELGTEHITDALFLIFLQGDIPRDHEEQLKIIQICIDKNFPTSLAWFLTKTEMTEFTFRSQASPNNLRTLAIALRYTGPAVKSLIIDLPFLGYADFEFVPYHLQNSTSLKKIDFLKTEMEMETFTMAHNIRGVNGDIDIKGGTMAMEPLFNSTQDNLPAAVFNFDLIELLSRVQLKTHVRNAISAVEKAREIEIKNLSKVRAPDISPFSDDVQKALKQLFRKAYETPYFMMHTAFSINMPHIFSSGSLMSGARLERLPGTDHYPGVDCPEDYENNAHYMVFASMGTNADSLMPPSAFEQAEMNGNDYASLIMNVDLFMQCNRSLRKYMMVKSCDWGEPREQVISIPNTAIKITRLKMESQNGPITPDARIWYKYENKQNGYTEEYTLPVQADMVTGLNYRQLIPMLFVQHLKQIRPAEQETIFRIIKGKESSGEDQQNTVKGILDAFHMMEISIPASLPLRLDYVDSLKYKGRLFDFHAVRNAAQAGRLNEIVAFMKQAADLPEGRAPDWMVEGVHGIAMKNWLTERAKYGSAQQADRFLAILDFIEPRYQENRIRRQSKYKPVYTSLDLLKESDGLTALAVAPSTVNLLVSQLRKKQESVKSYLTGHKEIALEAVKYLKETFGSIKSISSYGLQSTLKSKAIESSAFHVLVQSKDRIKALLYLAAATETLIAEIFGKIDLEVFKARNSSTELSIIGHISGIKRRGAQSQVNQSLLSDLLFNVPGLSLFVVGNSAPSNSMSGFQPREIVNAAYGYRLFFSALRDVLREENLIGAPITPGEQLLLERYESDKWGNYQERFRSLARMSEGKTIDDRDDEDEFHKNAGIVIRDQWVLDADYAHRNLDPRHLRAILAGNYGKAKSAFDELIETIAANPEADENHRTTAIQLFHRMKLLEFEFYKEQLINDVKLGFDDYARNVADSVKLQ